MIPLGQPKPLLDIEGQPNSSMLINAHSVQPIILADLPGQNRDGMCELKKWAKELSAILKKAPKLCDAMLSRRIDEGKYYDKFYLDSDNHVWLRRFNNGLEDLINHSEIQNLLARIEEGEK